MITGEERRPFPEPRAERFSVMFVCTGNICRSPFAEVLTRNLLVGKLGGRAAAAFDVASAGVSAVAGSRMHPDTRRELAPWRLDDDRFVGRFRARQLRPDLIARSDLVLGLAPDHRAAVVEQLPDALATTFTLREFARLAGSVDRDRLPPDPVARARDLIGLARLRRGMGPVVGPDADRVPDPMGGTAVDHRRAAELIHAAVRTVVDVITTPATNPTSTSTTRVGDG